MEPSKETVALSEHEALKKKVADLEATIARAKHIGAGVTVAVGILLGVGLLQVPRTIAKAVENYVATKATTNIDETLTAKTKAWLDGPLRDQLLKAAAEAVSPTLQRELNQRGIRPTTLVGDAQRGCAIAGAIQYCWGTFVAEQPSGNMHTRQFSPKFARAFANTPTVTTSALTKSDGTTYAVYDFERTPEGFAGTLVSSRNDKGQYSTTSHKVTMTYFAVAPTTRGSIPEERDSR